jgi:ribokinase
MILSFGSINADLQVRADALPDGPGTLAARDVLRTSGGKGANVAVLARRLGADALLLGCVGDDDLATQALEGPRREGVDVTSVRRVPGTTGLASIVVGPAGDKLIVLALNANDTPASDAGSVEQVERAIASAPPGSVLVVDLEVDPASVTAAVVRARHAGITVVLDPAPTHRLPDDLLSQVDHVTPDHREAAALTGIDTATVEGACEAAEALHQRGPQVAYVKLAAGGCAVAHDGGAHVIDPPPQLDVVDTTGAGDAFAGALAWALSLGLPDQEAAALAVAASACAVGAYGSQESYPSLDELTSMRARVPDRDGRPRRTNPGPPRESP